MRSVSKSRALIAATAVAGAISACNSAVDVIPAKLTALRAYYCAIPNQEKCLTRGDPIPAGTLPPANEAFQVWAFYQGWITTHWRVVAIDLAPFDSSDAEKFSPDSASVYLDFHGAAAPHYTLHVFIRGASAFLTDDSLRWDFP